MAERSELGDDASHHRAGRRGVGMEVRAEHGNPQAQARSWPLERSR